MKDNKGFSLIEMVIILAIMAALSGTIFYSFTLMTGQYSRECANNLSTALDKEKNYALTRSASVDCYMEVVKDGNSYVARYYVPESAIADGTDANSNGADWLFAEEFKIGKARVNLTCQIGSGSEITIDDDTSVKFVYNRISGAMKAIVESDATEPAAAGGVRRGYIPPDSEPKVHTLNGDKVIVASSYGRRYEIEVYTATGKHVLSRIN
ncbi:MAG: type II secretion system protein [Lachnospiraceae bacterium]|nr:type II secretion system protein [Lachnospiraceae bacterium]